MPELDINKSYLGWYLKTYEDMIAEVVSAMTGFDYLNNKIISYGEIDETIWVPRKIIINIRSKKNE